MLKSPLRFLNENNHSDDHVLLAYNYLANIDKCPAEICVAL